MREQPSKLRRAAEAQAMAEPSPWMKAVAGARVLEPYRIPRLGLDVKITLVGHHRLTAIEGEVFAQMKAVGLELNSTTELDYEAERAARTLAEAVLDPESCARGDFMPIADVADWRELDRNITGEVWRVYMGIVAAYDPISQPLSKEEIDAIEFAIKKKAEDPAHSLRYLRILGVARLSSYLLHTADRLFPSATPTSSPSESAPD